METIQNTDVGVAEQPMAAVKIGSMKGGDGKVDGVIICPQDRPVLLNDEMKQLMDRLAMQLPTMTRWAYGGKARAKVGLFVSRAKALAALALLTGAQAPSALSVAISLTAAEPSRTDYRAFTEDVASLMEELTQVIA